MILIRGIKGEAYARSSMSIRTFCIPAAKGKSSVTKHQMKFFKVTTGIPRMINCVCEKSLMYSFQQQKRIIDDYMVKYVIEHEMLVTN